MAESISTRRPRRRAFHTIDARVGHARAPASGHSTAAWDDIAATLRARRATRYERWVKPAIDRTIAAVLLLLLSPLLLLTTLVLWVVLGSPVLLRQSRVGAGGRSFDMFKFRTMRPDRRRGAAPDYHGVERRMTHKSAADPRHTRIGRVLRKYSIDELPQLLNVLSGDMSLVGPRPELTSVALTYESWQHARHVVRPGLTGLWQITERCNGTLMHERTDIDLDYVTRLSLRTDLHILVRTPLALLRKDGVI